MALSNYNLARNSRVFFTTNLDSSKNVNSSTFTTTNSQELTVLDGFTFSQTTTADTITLNEAGTTPIRGQRSFNTQLNPVDFSFSTYIRPYSGGTIKAEEACLWNALFSDVAIGATGSTVTLGATPSSATFATATATSSARITITGTGFTSVAGTTVNSTNLIVGEVVTIKGCTGQNASACNAPVRIVSASSTQVVADYLIEPANNPASTNFTVAGISFERTAWTENTAITADTNGVIVSYSDINVGRSNVNQLLPFGLVMTVDGITYAADNCVLDQATIDFGLDGIATVQWTGKATTLRQLNTNVTYSSATNPVLSGGLTGTISGKASAPKYITNKLSTVALTSKLYGSDGTAGTSYSIPLTGGNLTIANNVTYITPANIGVVNSPVTYFTGTRSITGTLNAYLKTGSTNTAGLLDTMLDNAATSTEPKFQLNVAIGGSGNAVRVETLINGANIQVPTVDAQAVMSTAINFTAVGTDDYRAGQNYNLEIPNEMRIRYFSN